jgi:uncharacterized membrane protein YgdD (TMEM256/DUF423 family)
VNPRTSISAGGLFGLLAVLLGAFGAHALAGHASAARLATWETAADYLAWHATAMILVGLLLHRWPDRRTFCLAGWLFFAGTLMFSGSLFLLVLTDIGALGALTPIGGVTLAGGWLALALGAFRLEPIRRD